MKSRSYTSEGIVLARKNFGEADRILIIYSKEYGRVGFIAKGVRRPKSRKRGHIEIFNQVRFQGVNTKGLDLITEAEVIDNFAKVRTGLKKVSLAYYLMEVVGRITHENEPNIELYNLLLETLKKIEIESDLRGLRLKFITKLLIVLGYWPEDCLMADPDKELEDVIERQVYSKRVGKRMLQ